MGVGAKSPFARCGRPLDFECVRLKAYYSTLVDQWSDPTPHFHTNPSCLTTYLPYTILTNTSFDCKTVFVSKIAFNVRVILVYIVTTFEATLCFLSFRLWNAQTSATAAFFRSNSCFKNANDRIFNWWFRVWFRRCVCFGQHLF